MGRDKKCRHEEIDERNIDSFHSTVKYKCFIVDTIIFLNNILTYHELPFQVISIILESGQRTAYNGYYTVDKVPVVIKTSIHNEIRIARIQREISILNEISSTYFPRFYTQVFISNEIIDAYIDSLDLKTQKEMIDEFRKSPPRPFLITCEENIEHMSWDDFRPHISDGSNLVEFVIHLFTALEILWNKNIVHRDIKPDNILIRPSLQPVVIDLGIAKSFRPGTEALTLYGLAPCTPQYAAPEQFDKDADVTYKTDQFAVGVIIYNILTNEFPFGRYNEIGPECLFANFKKGPPKHILDINIGANVELANFTHRLLEIEPYKRFRNASAIQDALINIRRKLIC